MPDYRYKCVPAPRRARRTREHKTDSAALVAAMEAAIGVEAAQGWEYLRTDVVPMERSGGLFSAASESHQGVMVFRRPAAPAAWDDATLGRPREVERVEIPRLGGARLD